MCVYHVTDPLHSVTRKQCTVNYEGGVLSKLKVICNHDTRKHVGHCSAQPRHIAILVSVVVSERCAVVSTSMQH